MDNFFRFTKIKKSGYEITVMYFIFFLTIDIVTTELTKTLKKSHFIRRAVNNIVTTFIKKLYFYCHDKIFDLFSFVV